MNNEKDNMTNTTMKTFYDSLNKFKIQLYDNIEEMFTKFEKSNYKI